MQGCVEAVELGAGEAACLAAWADASAEEALIGVDVADAVEDGLVEQRSLDGELASFEEVGESVWGDGGGFGAGAEVGLVGDRETAEAAGVDKTELAAIG